VITRYTPIIAEIKIIKELLQNAVSISTIKIMIRLIDEIVKHPSASFTKLNNCVGAISDWLNILANTLISNILANRVNSIPIVNNKIFITLN
jgi:hypothetical protein